MILFLPYTRKYDLDMLREISKEESKGMVVAISGFYDVNRKTLRLVPLS